MNSTETNAYMQPGLYRFLRRSIAQLRWATIAALLLLTLLWPIHGRGGISAWMLVALFAVYNLFVGLVRNQPPGLRAFAVVAVLDLLIGGLLYFLANEFGGVLFILFLFAVDSAAAAFTVQATLLYTGAVAAVAVAIDLAIRSWSPSAEDLRMTGSRLVLLALVGAGMALLTRRLTMEYEVARNSRRENDRLETLDRLRADFLATISHDLRTPLTAAGTALRLVETSAADRLRPDERDLLDNGYRNIERLGLLLDDLLALNQITAGTMLLERQSLDLRTVVSKAVSAVEPLLRDKVQSVTLDLPAPLRAEGDPWRLEQVLVNILANAHRHTPPSTSIVIRGHTSPGEVCLSVNDDGPGIGATEQEAIFRRFYRAVATGAGGEGVGLGLAIAKSLVELHGGRMWVESVLGQGATFFIALPTDHGGGGG